MATLRFHKVFDQHSSQSEVFDIVAKPVINSVIEGFNGTIFAYGQTGSGKTYAITGSPKNYNDRGIVPRSIQFIFAQNEKVSEKPTIYISYMEIYNEVGYDLLCSKQYNSARTLEELPRIVLLEDGKGEAHIRNLSVLPVTTEQEAMRLLFLGDTNRTIAETPMNEYSSRSHCIFTVYITCQNTSSNNVRFSKLHLIDLAGSERVYKCQTSGTALNEAKYINLSLHFLQQVILALSERKRTHIPYRNSMMTYILKDSLSGNCLTTMLATLAVTRTNIKETISTCKFAQRVSLLTTEPIINELSDPQQEISFLKNKVLELQKQVTLLTGFTMSPVLSKMQQDQCRSAVENYLNDSNANKELKVQPDFTEIQFCFHILKDKINLQKSRIEENNLESQKNKTEIAALKETVDNKDMHKVRITTGKSPENPVDLSSVYNKNPLRPEEVILTEKKVTFTDPLSSSNEQYQRDFPLKCNDHFLPHPLEDEKYLLKIFLSNNENSASVNYFTRCLEKKLEMARLYAQAIEQCQKNIMFIRQKLEMCSNCTTKSILVSELEEQQNIYRKGLTDLKEIKLETQHLESGLKRSEIEAMHKFKQWLKTYNCREPEVTTSYPSHVLNGFEGLRKTECLECLKKNEINKSCCENPSCCISNVKCSAMAHKSFGERNQFSQCSKSYSYHNEPHDSFKFPTQYISKKRTVPSPGLFTSALDGLSCANSANLKIAQFGSTDCCFPEIDKFTNTHTKRECFSFRDTPQCYCTNLSYENKFATDQFESRQNSSYENKFTRDQCCCNNVSCDNKITQDQFKERCLDRKNIYCSYSEDVPVSDSRDNNLGQGNINQCRSFSNELGFDEKTISCPCAETDIVPVLENDTLHESTKSECNFEMQKNQLKSYLQERSFDATNNLYSESGNNYKDIHIIETHNCGDTSKTQPSYLETKNQFRSSAKNPCFNEKLTTCLYPQRGNDTLESNGLIESNRLEIGLLEQVIPEHQISEPDQHYYDMPALVNKNIDNIEYEKSENSAIELAEEEKTNIARITSDTYMFFKETDSLDFKQFMSTVCLTGEAELDEEIFNFYRTKFC